MKARAVLVLLLVTACAAVAYQLRATYTPATPKSLTAYVPQDALLTIESPDFASLLHRWSNSAESKTWLKFANYAVFQNSRLFGRLSDAQTSFGKAAGVPAGTGLLDQVAGKESVFAWYDITKLEFLYVSRMTPAQIDRSQMFQARGSFERRHAGNADFYIRTSGANYGTVAFARVPTPSGELLLLATREDLIANALQLIAATGPVNSIQQEPWFRDVSTALPAERSAPVLHMVLNLDRIAVDPHFRSYWIQRNITWMRQFRAAGADLYIEPARFREERVLLPRSSNLKTATSTDLASLAALVPPSTGVFRVVATNDPADAVTAVQEKILSSATAPSPNPGYAPNATLDTQTTGSATDLETRIDTPAPVAVSASTSALKQVFQSVGLDAVLTLSSAQAPVGKDGLWVPIHAAVVLHTASLANPQTLALALQQTLRGSLTAANIGINFQKSENAGASIYSLTGPRPLFFAASSTADAGNMILFADDQGLLLEILQKLATSAPKQPSPPVTLIAVFNHSSQRDPYIRLTSLVDSTNHKVRDATDSPRSGPTGGTSAPAFFSENIRSLSNTFENLASERMVERLVGPELRQTVIYSWRAP